MSINSDTSRSLQMDIMLIRLWEPSSMLFKNSLMTLIEA